MATMTELMDEMIRSVQMTIKNWPNFATPKAVQEQASGGAGGSFSPYSSAVPMFSAPDFPGGGGANFPFGKIEFEIVLRGGHTVTLTIDKVHPAAADKMRGNMLEIKRIVSKESGTALIEVTGAIEYIHTAVMQADWPTDRESERAVENMRRVTNQPFITWPFWLEPDWITYREAAS